MTTYREGDKADTSHRDTLKQLGFAERELLIELGYPTQRFASSGSKKMSCPFNFTSPLVAPRYPVIIFIVVDFPAPFGPRNP